MNFDYLHRLISYQLKLLVAAIFVFASVSCNSSAQNSDIYKFINLIDSKNTYEIKPGTYQNQLKDFVKFADLQKDGTTWRVNGYGTQNSPVYKASIRFDGFADKNGKIMESSMQLAETRFILNSQYKYKFVDNILSKRHGKADYNKPESGNSVKIWLVNEFYGLELSHVGQRTMIRNIIYEGNAEEAY